MDNLIIEKLEKIISEISFIKFFMERPHLTSIDVSFEHIKGEYLVLVHNVSYSESRINAFSSEIEFIKKQNGIPLRDMWFFDKNLETKCKFPFLKHKQMGIVQSFTNPSISENEYVIYLKELNDVFGKISV